MLRSHVLEAIAVVAIVVIPLSVQAGVLSGIFNNAEGASLGTRTSASEQAVMVFDVPLLSAQQNPNPQGAHGGAEVVVVDGALVSSGPVGEDDISNLSFTTGEISVYTVREGDSLSQIAEMYGVTANTILWANDLKSAANIKPGQALVILPVAGVQHKVKTGETIASIVKKYDAKLDEVLSYNNLEADSALVVGEELIIPGGIVKAVAATVAGGTKPVAGWLIFPIPGAKKSQGIHGYNGVDLAGMPTDSLVRAAAAGTVVVARFGGWNGGYGNYVVIKHKNGVQTLYAHLNSIDVASGQVVAQGERIGGVGNTGRSTGIHLHFEVRGANNPF